MKCTECGTKCVKIDEKRSDGIVEHHCPSCFNTFERPARTRRADAGPVTVKSAILK